MHVLYTNKYAKKMHSIAYSTSLCVALTQQCVFCHTDAEVLSDDEQTPLRKQRRV